MSFSRAARSGQPVVAPVGATSNENRPILGRPVRTKAAMTQHNQQPRIALGQLSSNHIQRAHHHLGASRIQQKGVKNASPDEDHNAAPKRVRQDATTRPAANRPVLSEATVFPTSTAMLALRARQAISVRSKITATGQTALSVASSGRLSATARITTGTAGSRGNSAAAGNRLGLRPSRRAVDKPVVCDRESAARSEGSRTEEVRVADPAPLLSPSTEVENAKAAPPLPQRAHQPQISPLPVPRAVHVPSSDSRTTLVGPRSSLTRPSPAQHHASPAPQPAGAHTATSAISSAAGSAAKPRMYAHVTARIDTGLGAKRPLAGGAAPPSAVKPSSSNGVPVPSRHGTTSHPHHHQQQQQHPPKHRLSPLPRAAAGPTSRHTPAPPAAAAIAGRRSRAEMAKNDPPTTARKRAKDLRGAARPVETDVYPDAPMDIDGEDFYQRHDQQSQVVAASQHGGEKAMVAAPAKVCLYARWDDGHDDDPLLVSEYAEEIFEYMREMEQKHLPQPNYLKIQHEVDGAARNILVNWLIVVHARFSLRCETLYLAVNVMDRFLSLKTVSLPKFQLVGIASLLIACKYEEIEVPGVAALEYMADYGYSRGEIVRAERYVLGTLRHELGCPSPLSFVRRLARIDGFLPAPRTLCAFVMEAALTDEIMIGAPPSMLAAGAMYLARCMLRIGAWTPQHAMVSGYSEQVVTECAKGLYNTISRLDSRSSVYQKYSEERFSGVAKFVEAFLRNGA